MASSDLLKLHIPYVIEREFQTQQRKLCDDDLKKALSGLRGMTRKELSKGLSKQVSDLLKDLEGMSDSLLDDTENMFSIWADELKADRIPLSLSQASFALEAYFKGDAPLKSIKVREDIPDSFIARSIETILPKVDQLYFVVEDGKLNEAFKDNDKVTTCVSLSEFVSSDLIQEQLLEADLLQNFDDIKKAIASMEGDVKLIEGTVYSKIGDAVVYKTIYHDSIPEDNHEAKISGFYDPDYIELDLEDISYYGDGNFGVPFEVGMEVSVYYYIFKADYYALEDQVGSSAPSISDHNDHYFEAEDVFYIQVRGVANVGCDRDELLDTQDYEEVFAGADVEVAEVSDIKVLLELS